MRLKKLVLHGFKSFADRTEFRFDAPITGVVGPNGCGKSNVVDAIKWVLGEQSAKSLRGGAMLDVIFNGADARKPAGFAEVELVFDNPKRDDNTRLLSVDTDDVSIARRLYRDGTSEYQINKSPSRLKDIKEAFLDTGVGVDAYSIIEQGRVARLLDANPIERRQIFEEAAGISRFKVRRKETQRKLEKVDENLARLKDITDEIDRRLRGVRVQAGRARVYQEHAARLNELRLKHALHEYHTLSTKQADLKQREEDARFRLDDADGALQKHQNELALKREEAEALNQSRQHASHSLVETKSKIEQATQQIEYAKRQLAELSEQSVQLASDRETAEARLAEVNATIAELIEALESLGQSIAEQKASIDAKMAEHRTSQVRASEINGVLEKHKVAYLDAMRRLGAIDGRLNSIDALNKNQISQQSRLSERIGALASETETLAARRDEARTAIDEAISRINGLQGQVEERTGEASSLGAALKQLTERIGGAREHRSGLQSRQKILQEMENRREGMSDAVKHVLKNREKFLFLRGVVADLLRVDVEHAKVIEAALDGRDQWLVADPSVDPASYHGQLESLSGRVSVLRITPPQPEPMLVAEIAPEMVYDDPTWEPIATIASAAEPFELDIENSVLEDSRGAEVIRHDPASDADPRVGPTLYKVVAHLADTLSSTGLEGSPAPELFNETPIAGETLVPEEELDTADLRPWLREDLGYDWTQHKQPVRLAIDLVRFEPGDRALAEHLLGQTAITETIDDALTLHSEGPAGWRYITQAGDVIEADGTLRTGPLGASMGILSRRSELEALALQIAELDARVTQLTQELSQGNDQARALDQALSALRQDIYKFNTAKVELNMQAQQAQQRLDAIQREQPIIQREIDSIAAGLEKLASESEVLTNEKQQHVDAQQRHQQEVTVLEAEQKEIVEQQRVTAEQITALRVQLGQLEEKHVHAQQRQRQAEAQKQQFTQQIERVARSIEQLESRREQIHADQLDAGHRVEALRVRADELTRHVAELDGKITEASSTLKDLTVAVESARSERQDIEQKLHKLEIELSETGVRLDALVQRSREELQIEIAERYLEIEAARRDSAKAQTTVEGEPVVGENVSTDDQTEAAPTELVPEAIDWNAIAEEIRTLKEKIHRLGNVNLDAIGELDDLEKRQGDYSKQLADLADSKQQLEALIEQLNKDSSVRFEETFKAVRENFQQMFRKLFGGGKADIILETELEDKKAVLPEGVDPTTAGPIMKRVDALDAGIEVIARPPGKNPVTLSQLSGGEKAMTCIALLMSIFKAKPSPFCILDEVDAPLDEANNVRFGQIVQEFLDTSQFIIITHHKRTMQIADTLYGITQQVQGVSTRVQVKFEHVEAGGRIKDFIKEEEEVAA